MAARTVAVSLEPIPEDVMAKAQRKAARAAAKAAAKVIRKHVALVAQIPRS